MSFTADELRASRAAHDRYRHAAGKIDLQGNVSEPKRHDACRVALEEALNHRHAAHAADPEHTDPEWARDKAPHDQLLAFYESQIRRYAA
jgi:hypothetical protein